MHCGSSRSYRKMEEAPAGFRLTGAGSGVSDRVTGAYSAGREPEDYDVRAGIADIIRHGFFSISILSVVIFLLAIVGTAVSVAEVIGRADLMASLAGSAAAIVVAAFIILSALWDTVKDFIRYYDSVQSVWTIRFILSMDSSRK